MPKQDDSRAHEWVYERIANTDDDELWSMADDMVGILTASQLESLFYDIMKEDGYFES